MREDFNLSLNQYRSARRTVCAGQIQRRSVQEINALRHLRQANSFKQDHLSRQKRKVHGHRRVFRANRLGFIALALMK